MIKNEKKKTVIELVTDIYLTKIKLPQSIVCFHSMHAI